MGGIAQIIELPAVSRGAASLRIIIIIIGCTSSRSCSSGGSSRLTAILLGTTSNFCIQTHFIFSQLLIYLALYLILQVILCLALSLGVGILLAGHLFGFGVFVGYAAFYVVFQSLEHLGLQGEQVEFEFLLFILGFFFKDYRDNALLLLDGELRGNDVKELLLRFDLGRGARGMALQG